MFPLFNVRLIKRGGISFLTIGRFNFSWCVSRRLNKCFSPEERAMLTIERALRRPIEL